MIIVYSSSNCPACKTVKSRLDNWDVTYEVVEIDSDMEARAEVLKAGFRTVPQLKVNGAFIPNLLTLSKKDLIE